MESAERDNKNELIPTSQSKKEEHRFVREALRSDLPAAHLGLGATLIVMVVVVSFSNLRWLLLICGAFTVWFILALGIIRAGGERGWNLARRAYIATFGWGNWI